MRGHQVRQELSVMNAALLLLLLGVLFVFAVRGDAEDATDVWQAEKTTVTVPFDVSLGVQHYKSTMSQIERQLALTTTKPHIEKRPVLGQQKSKPDNWIHMTLKGQGAVESTLAIRSDTLYLVGFKTGGKWYAFKNRDRLIEGSTPLGFTDDYKSLTGGGTYEDLKKVPVGKKSAADALGILASYNHGSTEEKEVKKALIGFVLMLCEASRFQLVRADVAEAWEKGGTVGSTGVDLTVKWNTISCALLRWSKTKKWDSDEAKKIEDYGNPKMKNAAAAAANVFCILQVAGC